MRVFIAVVMGLAIASIGWMMLRGLRVQAPTKELEVVEEAPVDARITFYCENCHTEVLLLRRGSEQPPRHCGEKMIERTEIARGP